MSVNLLNLYYQNVNRIRSKLNDVFLNILQNNYDVICLTETNLNDSVYSSEFIDDRYYIFRRDRETSSNSKTDGGGVVIAVKKDINVIRRSDWDCEAEDIWVTLLIGGPGHSQTVHICACYLPPDTLKDTLAHFYSNMQSILLAADDNDISLVVGDFNTPNLSWSPAGPYLTTDMSHDFKSRFLLDSLSVCKLAQFNYVPNANGRFLDLALSNYKGVRASGLEADHAISKADIHHPPLLIELEIEGTIRNIKPKNVSRLNFAKCNYDGLKSDLREIDWTAELNSSSVDANTDTFYLLLNNLIYHHTPATKLRGSSYPSWFSPPLIKCLKEKQRYHRRYKRFHNPRDYDTYSLLIIIIYYYYLLCEIGQRRSILLVK
ncbi:hypothetical protein ABMA27_006750 [Loxostege sticticalis]|uniref:Endonuclease/exonuclease/phosphatase domain-containing protein n=1 Tax=Loxostege sticticalis TaxID=481309 RepID=A0ABR3IK96_LOXSC